MSTEIVVGIDLGTTNTCVGYFWDKKIEIIENKEGDRITPSVVFFQENQSSIVGKYAKRMSDRITGRTVSEVKRLIGRQYNDSYIQNNLQRFNFGLERYDTDQFKIVLLDNERRIIKKTPEDICSLILKKIKEDMDRKFGKKITKCVITVPAYFNVNQREATLTAAKLAGFDVLKLLNEPTSAALSYFYKNNTNRTCYAMVYDLGGGTFDVAILKYSNDQIDIISVDGDSHLGGHDFDQLLIDYVCTRLKNRYNFNARDKYEDLRRIMNECEEAKKELSDMHRMDIALNGIIVRPITIDLTREDLERLANDLFQRTITIVDRCLKSSQLEKHQIDEIILVGGSTRIPKIQQLIREYFNRTELNCSLHPDECVAEGAALQAAMLSTHDRQKIGSFTINDVTGLSLGIDFFCDIMHKIIPRNSRIPISRSIKCGTVDDKQTSIRFDIYEGERTNAKKNHLLSSFQIEDLTPAPPGQCEVTLTLSIDHNGILTATAVETSSGKTKDLKIAYTRGIRSDDEIQSTLVDAEINQKEDEMFLKMAESKQYLIEYCIGIKFNLDNKNLATRYLKIYYCCERIKKRAENLNVGDEETIEELTQEIETMCKELVKMYNFKYMPQH